jgi:proteasome alpha subunit
MSMPFYASAEQIMRDRSEYARKNIARGRPVVVLTYADGVLFVAENPSSTLHKVGEIYDRIGFAAVGRYSEYETLRVAGIRLADVRGYSYDRRDVTGRALANAYAQTLNSIFTDQQKPYEVELCVAEVGSSADDDRLYRLIYDGSIFEEPEYVVLGGQTEPIVAALKAGFRPSMPLGEALGVAARGLAAVGADAGKPRELTAAQLEVAVLDRTRPSRTFRRVVGAALTALMPGNGAGPAAPAAAPPAADTAAPAAADTAAPPPEPAAAAEPEPASADPESAAEAAPSAPSAPDPAGPTDATGDAVDPADAKGRPAEPEKSADGEDPSPS